MLRGMDRARVSDRSKALAGVAALHALLGYALVSGLGYEVVQELGTELKLFDVAEPPPPPQPESIPARQRTPRAEGAASPTSLKASPSPIVAPPPVVKLESESPIVTTPEPTPVPTSNDRDAGSSTIAGPGTGAGGIGTGTGSGGQGSGTGGGGATRAVRISGGLDGSNDYPKASRKAGIEGSVSVQFTVMEDGRVSFCRVLRSTANAEIEATTCRLIQRRFVYEPARDASGRAVPEVVRRTFDWTLPPAR